MAGYNGGLMEFQRGEEGQRHLRFIKIQSPLIAYSRNQTACGYNSL